MSFFKFLESNTVSYLLLTIRRYIKSINNTEYGYAALNFLVSRFTDNLNIFLFILSLCTLVPVFIGAIKLKKEFKVSISIQIFLYFTIFYGLSLNEMRQVLAVGWFFLAVSILLQNKKHNLLKAVIIWIIAFGFHRTALIGLIIFAVYYLFVDSNIKKLTVSKQLLVILSIFLAVLTVIIMAKSGNLTGTFSKYSQYINGTNSFGLRNIGMIRTMSLSVFPIISMIIIMFKEFKAKDYSIINLKNILLFFTAILFFDTLFMLGGIKSAILPRIGQYFEIFEIFLIPFSLNLVITRRERWIFYMIIIVYYLLIFTYITASGDNQIYPYQWILGNNY